MSFAPNLPESAVWTAKPSGPLLGDVHVPGDKSLSHRALILAALAKGDTEITGLLEGADVLATAQAVLQMGAKLTWLGPGHVRISSEARWNSAKIDCGNSGTGARLLMGAAAGFPIELEISGDRSLSSRPMDRVMKPLEAMGARFEGNKLPLKLLGSSLKAISYRMPVASAQVKSAILLAGLAAEGTTEVVETQPTRDHTERLLQAFGCDIEVTTAEDGHHIRLRGGQSLKPLDIDIPGDPSSAAFMLVAALIVPGSCITTRNILLNPLRTGLFKTLRTMGGNLEIVNRRMVGGEEVGDITASYSPLTGVIVPPERAPSMIDEYPILAIAAAFARGRTEMLGLEELRVKESDRIRLMAEGLSSCGISVQEQPQGLIIEGQADQPVKGGGVVKTHGDHRIAMSHLILGLAAQNPVQIDEPQMIATSFPGFADLMQSLGAQIEKA